MSTNNYFRCGYETFFFDANSAISIRSAWNEAIKYAALGLESDQPLSVSVFKPFSLPGPWQGCDVIGMQSVGYKPTHDLLVNGWLERRKAVDTLWSVT